MVDGENALACCHWHGVEQSDKVGRESKRNKDPKSKKVVQKESVRVVAFWPDRPIDRSIVSEEEVSLPVQLLDQNAEPYQSLESSKDENQVAYDLDQACETRKEDDTIHLMVGQETKGGI